MAAHPHKKIKTARPDHFYTPDGIVQVDAAANPTPSEDPAASRGIPVFRPSMLEFADFERFMTSVEAWGMNSGIVKIIPPEEWTAALPNVVPQLAPVRVKNPIEQDVLGSAGLYKVQNMEKNRLMSVREWHELCAREELRAPGIHEADRRTRPAPPKTPKRPRKDKGKEKEETPISEAVGEADATGEADDPMDVDEDHASNAATPAARKGRKSQRERLDAKAELDTQFINSFSPHDAWQPPETTAADYTPEFCRTLERLFWRSLGLGRPAWYGADSAGSLFTNETTAWNVASLPSALDRLMPAHAKLPGVNTPYLYFGMWRATFAWHVEDMDLFSINYIHFGAPKHWYAIPQAKAVAFEGVMKSFFPSDIRSCPQFLRHKAFLVSPTQLAQKNVRPNVLVQHEREFVITYPRGYHAGFNLGFNCAESVNFALDSWIELGRKAAYCTCISDSVRIDVDELLAERAAERQAALSADPQLPPQPTRTTPQRKRKAPDQFDPSGADEQTKRARLSHGSRPKAVSLHETPDPALPCCLCASPHTKDLLLVHDQPLPGVSSCANVDGVWRAHAQCARVVPETWVDEVEEDIPADELDESMSDLPIAQTRKVQYVFGVDAIVKDRWNLRCQLCTTPRTRAHGAPIQCARGKCPKAFHVSCARRAAGLDRDIWDPVDAATSTAPPLTIAPADLLAPSSSATATTPLTISPADLLAPSTSSAIASADPLASTSSIPAPPTPAANPLTSGVSYTYIGEIEKSVVLGGNADDTVVSTIHKDHVEVFCGTHNDAAKADRKSRRDDERRALLVPGARIRVRTGTGIYEVTLARVVEEQNGVEVMWGGDAKKVYKFGSVVWKEDATTSDVTSSSAPVASTSAQVGSNLPVLITPSQSLLKLRVTPSQMATLPAHSPPPPRPAADAVQSPTHPLAASSSTKGQAPHASSSQQAPEFTFVEVSGAAAAGGIKKPKKARAPKPPAPAPQSYAPPPPGYPYFNPSAPALYPFPPPPILDKDGKPLHLPYTLPPPPLGPDGKPLPISYSFPPPPLGADGKPLPFMPPGFPYPLPVDKDGRPMFALLPPPKDGGRANGVFPYGGSPLPVGPDGKPVAWPYVPFHGVPGVAGGSRPAPKKPVSKAAVKGQPSKPSAAAVPAINPASPTPPATTTAASS